MSQDESDPRSTEADAEAVRARVVDLYSKSNAADADALAEYALPAGVTMFVEDGSGLITLNQDRMRGIFAAGSRTDFKVWALNVRVFGESAIVTGYRAGSFTMPDEEPVEGTFCLTQVWVKESGQWRLAHIHISPLSEVLHE